MYWFRYILDMVFYITVILLLMNMINGVIVSTFSQIREESESKEDDMNNKCFVCSIEKVEFEKRKINFDEHLKVEHNVKNYIKYLISLKLINEKDLDSDQSYIVNCLNNAEIACFPVNRAGSIGEEVIASNEEEDNE